MAPNPNPKTRERERLDDLIDWAGEHADERGSYLADVFHHLTELRLRRYHETGDQEVVRGINGVPVVGLLLGGDRSPRVFSIEGRAIVGAVLGPQSPVQEGGRLFVSADGTKQVRESINPAANPEATSPDESLERLIAWAGEHADERGTYLSDVYTHLLELRIRRKNDWAAEDAAAPMTFQGTDGEARAIHLDPADDDLYEPGRFECGNCDFTMGVSVIIHGMDGIERPGVIPREMLDNPPLCPRCHEPMHRLAWRKQAEFYQRCLVNAQEDIARLQADLGNWRENAAGPTDVLNRLNAEIDRAEKRVGRIRDDHDSACQTIAAMHKAALGVTRGPIRGVVEDVQDLADLVDGFAEFITDGAAPLHVGANLMAEHKRLHPMSRGTRRGSGAERARARGAALALADDQLHRGNVGPVVPDLEDGPGPVVPDLEDGPR